MFLDLLRRCHPQELRLGQSNASGLVLDATASDSGPPRFSWYLEMH